MPGVTEIGVGGLIALLVLKEVTNIIKMIITMFKREKSADNDAVIAGNANDIQLMMHQVSQMHEWHNREDSDGVKIWHRRRDLDDLIVKMCDHIRVQTELLRAIADDVITLRSNTDA